MTELEINLNKFEMQAFIRSQDFPQSNPQTTVILLVKRNYPTAATINNCNNNDQNLSDFNKKKLKSCYANHL
ncbi:Uncharacterized protein BM_BM17350 [Brugia malayi]|uniref:Uncharacterized protein n=1 Tax=Brugia malayi TaxID=6279 RepID=A0A4E9F1G4_BRUMA|nr:Uncharacterized protein BM_BM17350 [Brugia malayi]VIO90514.1 Uncharacterized protein BM_BM17350 [Brugia malayi]